MKTKLMRLKSLYIAVTCLVFASLVAKEDMPIDTTAPKTKSFEEQKREIIKNLKKIVKSFDEKLLGFEATKSTSLTTQELAERIIRALNYTIQVRAYLVSIPAVEAALGHPPIAHATNHLSTVTSELDDAERAGGDARQIYVMVYRYFAPFMLDAMQSVVQKAIKILEWGD